MIRRTSFKGIKRTKKRRKKGEITKLKEQLWQLCRALKPETTCYTCGRENLSGSNRQLGHFIASSLCSVELRYTLGNLKIQCYNCNINKSGNTLQFRLNLVRDYGELMPQLLWEINEKTKGRVYTKEWFEEKIAEYSALKEKI